MKYMPKKYCRRNRLSSNKYYVCREFSWKREEKKNWMRKVRALTSTSLLPLKNICFMLFILTKALVYTLCIHQRSLSIGIQRTWMNQHVNSIPKFLHYYYYEWWILNGAWCTFGASYLIFIHFNISTTFAYPS